MERRTPSKVLITGANGFIGKALMAHFRRAGVPTVGIDLKGDGGDVHAGDTGAPDGWAHLMQGCDVVIHTAALVSNAMKDDDMWRTNVLATRNLLGAAAAQGIRRFVHLSSIVVYGNAARGEIDEEWPVHADGGSYVRTKVASEHVALAAHIRGPIEVVIVRPGDVYGPGCRVWIELPLQMMRKRQFLLPAMGEGLFRPVYIEDLVRGIALAATVEGVAGEIFNLACQGSVTTREFFRFHARWLGMRGPWVVPTSVALVLAAVSFRLGLLFGIRSEGSAESVAQLATRSWYSIQKAERRLGWKPEVPFEEGMKRTESRLRQEKAIE